MNHSHAFRGVSHDLRNILALATCPLDTMKKDASPAVRQAAGSIGLCIETCCALLSRELGQANAVFAGQRSLREIIELAMNTACVGCDATIDSQLPRSTILLRHDHVIFRSVFNLLHNAATAAGPGANIIVEGDVVGDFLVLCVEDDGPGLSDEVLEWFDYPLPRGSREPECVGIGLPSTRRMLSAIGGTLSADTRPAGARIMLSVPGNCWEQPPMIEQVRVITDHT